MIKTLLLFNNHQYVEFPADRNIFLDHKLKPCLMEEAAIKYDSEKGLINGTIIESFKKQRIDWFEYLIFENESESYCVNNITRIKVGKNPDCHIVIDENDAEILLSEKILDVVSGAVFLNGKELYSGRYPIMHGDCILIGSFKITHKKEYIECNGAGYICNLNIAVSVPKKYGEFPVYKRSPRIIKKQPEDTIDIIEPAQKEKRKKGEIVKIILPPIIMLCAMIAVSIVMKRGLFVLVTAAGTLMTVIFSVTTFITDKNDKKRNEAERVDTYQKYLLEMRKKLFELADRQKESLLFHNPSVKEISEMVKDYSSRLYERSENDSDFLTLCVGYCDMFTSFKVKYKNDALNTQKDELKDEMIDIVSEYQSIPDMPVVIDLKKAHLGIIGEKENIQSQLQCIIAQICFFQSYHDIEVITLVDEDDVNKFEWIKWYPHCKVKNINISGLVYGENQRDQVLGNIAQILKFRKQKKEEEKKDGVYLPYYIFIIDNPKLVINHSIMEYLQGNSSGMGFCMIYTTNIQANLPENVKTILMLDSTDKSTLFMNEGTLVNKHMSSLTAEGIKLEEMSRRLAPIVHNKGVSTQIPDSITFFEMYNIKNPQQLPIQRLWAQNASYKSLAVPLGVRAKEDYVYLDLHEKSHGPHGLVAGTTGSGKSEILQSYILSLAVNFHPHEVGFLLIDYKGGGMANLFNKLPHLLGTITNLDGSESMRALASIKSELARRQRIFNEYGVNNINQYTKLFKAGEAGLPMPHLFLISDEFAELKKEQPDFMTELVSAARIGRSLGVHLILATQKPTGVVDDQIWSNSKFKLALKVQDESDSKEVLKTPDAARITQPGRAILQVGNNEIYEMFQSAWSGAAFNEDEVERGFDNRVYLLNFLGQGQLLNEDLSNADTERSSKVTQLDAVVEYIYSTYSTMNCINVEKPWLPPLSQKIFVSELSEHNFTLNESEHNLSCAVGIVDIPEQQIQMEYIHNFEKDGNFVIFGAPGFGKSTTEMTIALSLAAKNSSALLNYYVLDFGNSSLAQLRALPQTADYISFDDSEKLKKFIKYLSEEMRRRKTLFSQVNAINFNMYNSFAEQILPAIIIFIDNYDVVKEIGMELEDFIAKLTRDGTGVGIYTVISASRTNSVRYAVLNNFKNKIAQFMFDSTEITAVVGRSNYKIPEVKGRALIKLKDVCIMQCYLPAPYENDLSYIKNINQIIRKISENNHAPVAEGIRMLPEILQLSELENLSDHNLKTIALGLDTENVEVQYLNLNMPVFLAIGAAQTGKTNFLKLIIKQIQAEKIFISDSIGYDLQTTEGKNIIYMSGEAELEKFTSELIDAIQFRRTLYENSGMDLRPREFFAGLSPIVIIIDDADRFIDLCKSIASKMEVILAQAIECGVCIIATTLASRLRGYDNITKLLKDTQNGIIFGNPVEQSIFSLQPPRGYHQLVDMGFIYSRGDYKLIKLPYVK